MRAGAIQARTLSAVPIRAAMPLAAVPLVPAALLAEQRS
jgi:hypothetical protein